MTDKQTAFKLKGESKMSTKSENCKKNGHSFVESSIGTPTTEARREVHLYCQRCGEVKVIKQAD